LRNEMK